MKTDWITAWSLDAPLVLVAYFWALIRMIENGEIPVVFYILLGVGIWLGYMADRIFDVMRRPEITLQSKRHRSVDSRKWIWVVLWSVMVIALVMIGMIFLDRIVYLRGWILACCAAGYVFIGSTIRGEGLGKWSKKLAAALLLTIAPWVFVFEMIEVRGVLFSGLFFVFSLFNLLVVDVKSEVPSEAGIASIGLAVMAVLLSLEFNPLVVLLSVSLSFFYLGHRRVRFLSGVNNRLKLDLGLLCYCLLVGGLA